MRGHSTYRDNQNGVHPRPRARVKAEHGCCERHLLCLPEDVDAETGDDDSGDVDAACAELNPVEHKRGSRCDESREPGHELIDDSPDERCRRYATHADKTKEAYDKSECVDSSAANVVKGWRTYVE